MLETMETWKSQEVIYLYHTHTHTLTHTHT